MRHKNILFFLGVLNVLLFCLIFANKGSTSQYYTQIIFSSQDSHIFNEFPNNNYGNAEFMHCGNYVPDSSFALRRNIAFIYFNISSIESGWEVVSLALTVHNIPEQVVLSMGLVHDHWSEETLTWFNFPSNISLAVKSLNFSTDSKNIFEVTDLINSSSLEFNIMLYDQGFENDLLINTKEYPDKGTHPQLEFSYPDHSVRPLLSDNIRLIIIIFSCLCGLTYLMIKILKRKKLKKINDN